MKLEHGNFELRLGDCLDPVNGMASLGAESVDVVMADPPYSEHVHASVKRGAMSQASRGLVSGDGSFHKADISRSVDLGFEALSLSTLNVSAGEMVRIARRWSLVFSDTESAHLWAGQLIDANTDYVRTCFWHKVGGAPQFTGDRPAVAVEAITCAHRVVLKRWN